MPAALSIDQLPQPKREAAWRDAVCDTFVRLECKPDAHAPLHGRLEAGTVGALRIARVTASPQHVERTAIRAAQDDQPLVLMSVQLRGRTLVRQGCSEALLTPGCIAFYDTARPYTLSLPYDFDQIVVQLPRQTLEGSVPHGLSHMAERLSASNPFAQAILALAPQLLRMVDSANHVMAARTAVAAQELISLALDSLVLADDKLHHQSAHRPAEDALAWRTRDLIGRQLDDTALTPRLLATQLCVSLRRLQEVFQAQGTTLSDCIWDMRLEFSRSLLAAPHQQESISTIAYRTGFSDVAHFSRRFKQRYGVSPSAYRSTQI